MPGNKKFIWISIYAITMAYLEAAAVVYLRQIYGIGKDITIALKFDPLVGMTEVGREVATMMMILAVAVIAGNSKRSRIGFFLFVFGVWDFFYYIWLKVILNWPNSLLDLDLLFLLPLPWWGPVLSPLLIAVMMILTGYMMVITKVHIHVNGIELALLILGTAVVLYSFMKDAISLSVFPGIINFKGCFQ